MRVVLLNPPVPRGRMTNRDLMGGMGIDDGFGVGFGPRFVALLKNEGTRMPVLALASAKAQLAAHDVTVLDLTRLAPDDPQAMKVVCDANPEWIVSATSFGFLGAELRFLDEAHRRTNAKRLLLGYSATHFARDILERGLAEAVSKGDAEVAVRAMAEGSLAPGLDGVLMRDEEGRFVPAKDGFLQDLDALASPDWSGFPLADYQYFPLLKKTPFVLLQSSRGCPYGCHFCPYPIAQGAPFRGRSPKNVVDEMQRAVETFGAKSILFRDPTFSMDQARTKEICREILARGVQVEWGVETRLDRMDEEMIELLGRAGCRSAEFGVDPIEAPTRFLSKRKGIDPDKAAGLISLLEKNGVATAGLFVIGIPGMDRAEMERTIEWIETLEMSYVNYEIATPFPGTPMYDKAVQAGWTKPITFDALMDGDPKLSFNGVIDVDEMKRLQDRALSRFYLRPRKIAREVFNEDLLRNLTFFAKSGLKFLASELG